MRRGHFITFEGVEGSGKTTQLACLKARLEAREIPLLATREPGGTALGNRIRGLLLGPSSEAVPMAPKAELFLYLASRAQHLVEVILPALGSGKLVLCDRFSDATMAYQGAGRAIPGKELASILDFASEGLKPDLTFLLDLDVKEGIARARKRGGMNRLDQESKAFHEAIRASYLDIARKNPKRIKIIQASEGIEASSKKIGTICDDFLAS